MLPMAQLGLIIVVGSSVVFVFTLPPDIVLGLLQSVIIGIEAVLIQIQKGRT